MPNLLDFIVLSSVPQLKDNLPIVCTSSRITFPGSLPPFVSCIIASLLTASGSLGFLAVF